MPNKKKHIIETHLSTLNMDKEDGGRFIGFTANNSPEEDNGMYVRVCSWDDNKKHEEIYDKFVGRKIRITIETI